MRLGAGALVAAGVLLAGALGARADTVGGPPAGTPISFSALSNDDPAADAAFAVFRAECLAAATDVRPSRAALPPPAALEAVCAKAMAEPHPVDGPAARAFFATNFTVHRVGAEGSAFFTGYYEPVVDGALTRTAEFDVPLYRRPATLVASAAAGQPASLRRSDGSLVPVPDRAGIETGGLGAAAHPLVYVHDAVEAFFVQVQGSARIRLPDGSLRRLAYAGRNGYPYSSIGKILVRTLNIPPEQMGLKQLKTWIRAHGQGPDDAGTKLMQRNRSYIFLAFDDALPAEAGPIGGAGVSLTSLRSLAIDRTVWPYGLPFYVDAVLPWRSSTPTPFRRLMVGQDTGSAILGRARADIFFGSGSEAADLSGPIRHPGTLYVLWPRDEGGDKSKSKRTPP